MKKLLLATALAVSAPAAYSQAINYTVSSNITEVQLFVDRFDLVVPCIAGPAGPSLALSGTATDNNVANGKIDASDIDLTGHFCLNVAGVDIRLTFALTDGTYSRDDPGTTFTDGTVDIEVYSSGWVPYDTIVVAANHIPCIADRTGHMSTAFPPDDTQITAGLLLNNRLANASTTRNLPGLWTKVLGEGVVDEPGYNDAVCVTTLLGNRAGLYLKGEVTLTRNP